jgi:hypothetical protein
VKAWLALPSPAVGKLSSVPCRGPYCARCHPSACDGLIGIAERRLGKATWPRCSAIWRADPHQSPSVWAPRRYVSKPWN